MKKAGAKEKREGLTSSPKKANSVEGKKKSGKLKPIKSKELKRTKDPSIFEEDEDFLDDNFLGLDDLGNMDVDLDDPE
jgi:hypothetical protein